MKCLLNKDLWENTGCIINTIKTFWEKDGVTVDCFILVKLKPIVTSFLLIFH